MVSLRNPWMYGFTSVIDAEPWGPAVRASARQGAVTNGGSWGTLTGCTALTIQLGRSIRTTGTSYETHSCYAADIVSCATDHLVRAA